MSRISLRLLVGLVMGLGSVAASAQNSCSNALSSYDFYVNSSPDPVQAAYILANHPQCFGGSSTSSAVQMSVTSFMQAGAISQALGSRIRATTPSGPLALGDSASGLAAGNGQSAFNVWASHNAVSSSIRNANGGRNDSDTGNTIVGADYALTPKMAAGVSIAMDRTSGSDLGGNPSAGKGLMVAPYIGYQLSKELSLDVSAGFGNGELTAPGTSADARRWFGSANLGYTTWMGNWQVSGKGTYLHGEEKYENAKLNGAPIAGTASKNRMDQVRIGGQAGYWMNGVMPYAGLTYAADVRRASTLAVAVDPLGRSAYVLDLGLNFISVANKMTGGLAYQQEFNRSNSKNSSLLANLNVRF